MRKLLTDEEVRQRCLLSPAEAAAFRKWGIGSERWEIMRDPAYWACREKTPFKDLKATVAERAMPEALRVFNGKVVRVSK